MYSGTLNLVSGNYQLTQPICSWSGRGGGISLNLYFNSQSIRTDTLLGTKWSHSYNTRIVAGTSAATIVAGDGTETVYTLSSGQYTAPVGVYSRLAKNTDGTWTLTTKDAALTYRFRADGLLSTLTDNNANVTSCAYSGTQLISVTDVTGRAVQFAYATNRLSSITDFEGRVWTLSYTGGLPTQVAFPALQGVTYTVRFGYTSGNVTAVTNRLNKTWAFAYSTNRLTQMTDPDGKIWTYSQSVPGGGAAARMAYPWPADVVTVQDSTDPSGNTVQYGIDGAGRISAIKGATDSRAVYTYDTANNRRTSTTDSGAVWQWSYDSRGNQLSSTDPLNAVTQMTYNANSQLLAQVDPLGNQTSYQYDARGNRTTVVDPENRSYPTLYDIYGQVYQSGDGSGNATSFTRDARGNVTQIADALNNTLAFAFAGTSDRAWQRTDALGRVTEYDFDAWGRQTATRYVTTGATGATSVYDAEGRLTQSADATGTRTYTYDAWNRRTAMTDPMGNTQAAYNATGGLLTQTDVAGRTHSYGYDSYNRLASVGDGTQSVQYTYTSDNQVATALYPNGTRAEYSYDLSGRVTGITHRRLSNNSVIVGYSATYDSSGRTTQVSEQPTGAVTTYQYDQLGRLLREERTGNRPYLSIYTYNSAGDRATAFRSENGITIHSGTYLYSSARRLTQVVDAATSFTEQYSWNADGTLASFTRPDYTRRMIYDGERQITALRRDYGNGNVQLAYEYGYAADGGRRWRKDYDAGTQNWYPCGVSCCAGALVEKGRPLAGGSWVTTATYLRGVSLVSRNNEYFHEDIVGQNTAVSDASGVLNRTTLLDYYGSAVYASSSTAPLPQASLIADEGLMQIASGAIAMLPARGLQLQQFGPQQTQRQQTPKKKPCNHDKLDQCRNRVNNELNTKILSQNVVCLCRQCWA